MRLEQWQDASTAAWPRVLHSFLFCHSLMHIITEKWTCRSFFWSRVSGQVEGSDGQLGFEAEWSQGMRGKHPTSVLHPGQQESKQSITCRGPPSHSLTQTLVSVFCHYGEQHCDVIWLSSWTESKEAQRIRMVLVKVLMLCAVLLQSKRTSHQVISFSFFVLYVKLRHLPLTFSPLSQANCAKGDM